MAHKTLDPKLDVVFKLMFVRRPALLVPLVESVLHLDTPVVSATVVNPDLPKDHIDQKGAVLDLHILLGDGRHVDLEMQQASRPGLRERALYYGARLLSAQLPVGASHEKLVPCSVIFFVAETLFAAQRLHSAFRFYEEHDGTLLSPALEVHFVELPKLEHAAPAEVALQRWCRFFMAYSDEELAALAEEDPVMKEAKNILDELSADDTVQELARSRQLAWAGYIIDMAGERSTGRKEGRKEGLVTAIALLAESRGLPLDEDRRRRLSSSSTEELEALFVHLDKHGRWPS